MQTAQQRERTMDEPKITTGARRLARWLEERNITNVEFGRRLGVAGHSVWRWQAGYAFPRFAHIEQITIETEGFITPDDWLSDEARLAVDGVSR
jgi:transcriptional regulator with XRE-family HTH domain